MASAHCELCGVETYMPYACKFCKGRYCAAHRLPENHTCQGLDAYRERMRAEGRVFAPEPDLVQAQVSPTARAGVSMDRLWDKLDGRMTYVFIGVSVAVFVLQFVGAAAGVPVTDWLAIDREFLTEPWTLLTSVFAHGGLNHLFINMLVLLFFGVTTERLVGTKRFAVLFLVAGMAAGLAQVLLSLLLFPQLDQGVVGASGAIQGVMGTLVVLAPRLTVLVFFVIPAPLWALTAFYVLFDVLGAFNPTSGTAHWAHLAGLGLGLAYGWYLREKRGLRAHVQRPETPMRRYF